MLSIKVKPFANFFKHSGDRIRFELETVSFASVLVKMLNGIVETSGRANHRHRAISRAIHLIQPTWFIKRRHKKQIGAGFDLMRERLARIAFVNSDAMRCGVVPGLQKMFVLPGAGAERDKERDGVQDVARGFANTMITLLCEEPRRDWHVGG